MKKLKIVCFSLMSIFLLFFGVFSFGVEVKAAYEDEWDAPESAKNFVDVDGGGIRLYILYLYGDDVSGELDYARMSPVKKYTFNDGELRKENYYDFGRDFFESDLLDGLICETLQFWGSGTLIADWSRIFVVYNVEMQQFELEWYGRDYWNYWLPRFFLMVTAFEEEYDRGYDDGYTVGFDDAYELLYEEAYLEGLDEGYDEGYYYGRIDGYNEGIQVEAGEAFQAGFNAGQKSKLTENNAAFYQGIEKWLVPAIITVIALGGFVTIAVNKRRGE